MSYQNFLLKLNNDQAQYFDDRPPSFDNGTVTFYLKPGTSPTIAGVLNTLEAREQKILMLRFGLGGYQPHTLEETGAKFGVTRERIRQIEKGALQRLRHPSRSRKLRGYYAE